MIYCKFYRVQCKIMNVLHELDGRVTLSTVLYENRIILTTCLFINWWIYNATNYPHMNFISFEKSIHANFTGNFTWNSLHMIFHKNFSHINFLYSVQLPSTKLCHMHLSWNLLFMKFTFSFLMWYIFSCASALFLVNFMWGMIFYTCIFAILCSLHVTKE